MTSDLRELIFEVSAQLDDGLPILRSWAIRMAEDALRAAGIPKAWKGNEEHLSWRALSLAKTYIASGSGREAVRDAADAATAIARARGKDPSSPALWAAANAARASFVAPDATLERVEKAADSATKAITIATQQRYRAWLVDVLPEMEDSE